MCQSHEQIELPYPELNKDRYVIDTGLDDNATLIVDQNLLKAVFALAVTPEPFAAESKTERQYRPPNRLPAGTRFVGTGFRFNKDGLFATAAHLFEIGEWQRLVEERKIVAICAVPGADWTPLPVQAICCDAKRDLAIGLLPTPAEADKSHLVGDVGFSDVPLTKESAGMLLAAGFQDTEQNWDEINLHPVLFRGTDYSLASGPFEVGHQSLELDSVIRVRMKARPGLSGSPLIAFRGPDDNDEYSEGRAYGVQSFINEVDPELTYAHFIPTHHLQDIQLDHAGFTGLRGKCLRQVMSFV